MQTNEFRVRPVTRFALTHYQEGEGTASSRTIGEFPNVEAAEEVGVALQVLVPGSLLTTLDGRAPLYPPKALAAAMATAAPVDVAAAMNVLRAAMAQDPDYAWAWHCNIAMAARDAGAASAPAQAQAAQFVRNAFGVDTAPMAVKYGLDVAPVAPINGDHLASLMEKPAA
jgi:hypothetical protein